MAIEVVSSLSCIRGLKSETDPDFYNNTRRKKLASNPFMRKGDTPIMRGRETLDMPHYINIALNKCSDEGSEDRQRWSWVFASSEGLHKFASWFPEFRVRADETEELKRVINMNKDNWKWSTIEDAEAFLNKRVEDIKKGIF